MQIPPGRNKLLFLRCLNRANELKKTDPEKALEIIIEARIMGFSDPRILGIESQCLRYAGRIPEAIVVAEENCRLFNNDVSFGILSQILFEAKRIDGAIEAGEKSVELSGGSEISKSILKRAKERKLYIIELTQEANKFKKDDPEKALLIIEKVKTLEVDNIFVLGIKCECLLNLGRNEEALKEAQESARIQNNSISYALLALSFTANGKIMDAVEAAEKCCEFEINKKNLRLLFMTYSQAGLIEQLKDAAKKNSDKILPEDFMHLGHDLRKGKFYLEAIEILRYADQSDSRTDLCKAFCEINLGRFLEAMQTFEKSVAREVETRFKIRYASGILFLCQHLFELWAKIVPKAEAASIFLDKIDPSEIGDQQEADYKKALGIAKQNFPDLFSEK